MTVGIDASNIFEGGGKNHLVNILASFQPDFHDIRRVVVFGSKRSLLLIGDYPWLLKRNIPLLNFGVIARLFWVTFKLNHSAKKDCIDILLVPGGILTCSFSPSVIICQNLLPFDWYQFRRHRFSIYKFRLAVLRLLYTYSFRQSQGVIFLTNYAQKIIFKNTGEFKVPHLVIRHGISLSFFNKPKAQYSIQD